MTIPWEWGFAVAPTLFCPFWWLPDWWFLPWVSTLGLPDSMEVGIKGRTGKVTPPENLLFFLRFSHFSWINPPQIFQLTFRILKKLIQIHFASILIIFMEDKRSEVLYSALLLMSSALPLLPSNLAQNWLTLLWSVNICIISLTRNFKNLYPSSEAWQFPNTSKLSVGILINVI